jgi:signal transduction histidine kinase
MDRRSIILIVDDEPRNLALLRASLSPHYELIEAHSGSAALEAIKRAPIDLVLLDVMMPEQDGFDSCRLIKAEERATYLPVILVTALSDQADRNRGLEAGADDFLPKPVDRRELLLRVRHFLRLQDQERVIRAQVDELRRLQSLHDEMVGLLVHDLRNPLAGVHSNVELALESSTADGQREDLQHALRACEGMRAVLDETLQVRLLEEHSLIARRGRADLGALAAAAAETVQPLARRRGIDLRISVEGDASAELDERLVRRSVENLLSNAVKYSALGKPVSLRVVNRAGLVEIEVSDGGKGIPDALKRVLFQRFGSLEARRGTEWRGIGLGLYLVKLVAEAHGGDVSVHDAPGGGALFRMRLGPPMRAFAGAA